LAKGVHVAGLVSCFLTELQEFEQALPAFPADLLSVCGDKRIKRLTRHIVDSHLWLGIHNALFVMGE
jgi:hypothetical protein